MFRERWSNWAKERKCFLLGSGHYSTFRLATQRTCFIQKGGI